MVEKIVLECNVPNCPTPAVNVKRCISTVDNVTVEIDLCENDRAPIIELRKYANDKRRRPRRNKMATIRVVDPEQIPRQQQ